MNRYPRWPIHLMLMGVSFVMLVPFYWVLKTSLTGENIFGYPGMGLYFVTAINDGDFPKLMPFMVFVVLSVLLFNLMSDLTGGIQMTVIEDEQRPRREADAGSPPRERRGSRSSTAACASWRSARTDGSAS